MKKVFKFLFYVTYLVMIAFIVWVWKGGFTSKRALQGCEFIADDIHGELLKCERSFRYCVNLKTCIPEEE